MPPRPPKTVAEIVGIYLRGWFLAGTFTGILCGGLSGRFLAVPIGAVLGLVVGAVAARGAADAFRRGLGPSLLFPAAFRWGGRGAVAGYLVGVAAWLLWDRLAPESSREGLFAFANVGTALPIGGPALGYVAGLSAGFARAVVRGPPPDVTDVFE